MSGQRIRVFASAALGIGFLGFLLAPLGAHHITRFTYTWMQVGKADVDGYRVTVIVKPPERSVGAGGLAPKGSPDDGHKDLERFTHHFQVFVEDLRLREPVPYLEVTLSARKGDGFRQDFPLAPRFEERGFHYGANVRLARRGRYDLVVVLSPGHLQLSEHSKRRKEYFRAREVKFDFEYGYQGLKELMGDLFGGFKALSGDLLALGLPEPAQEPALRAAARRARELDGLAGLIPQLRYGERQDEFTALAEDLKKKTGRLAQLVERGRLEEAAGGLAEVRVACGTCHRMFREGPMVEGR